MQETELRLSDLLVLLLRKWRSIVIVGLVLALCLGIGAVAVRVISLNIPSELERMQAEYEVAYGQYWSAIDTVERKIRNNENYVEQAKSDLEDLTRKKENYEYDIEDLKADIEYYSLQVIDLEKNIEVLEIEKENAQYRLSYRNEQNEQSLIMEIDPYDVKISEIFLRVDAGYQIIPGSVYQDPDPTEELMQTYRLLVANAEFYEKMIADLGLDTEVRYLTEVVSVISYNSNSLRVRVIGDNQEKVQQMAEYLCNALLENHSTVTETVAEHTIDIYSRRDYSVVEMEIFNQQQAYLKEATDLEGTIRELDAEILNTQAAIRQTRADMREFEDDIENIKATIANLPVKEEDLNSIIADYQDEINQLRIERLDLLKKDVPSEPGITVMGALIRFVKYAVIGGVVGVLLSFIWIIFTAVASGKVLSAKQVAASYGIAAFGVWPAGEDKDRPFAFVDRWVNRVAGCTDADAELVCANIAASVASDARILICGDADEKYISEIAADLKKKYAAMDIVAAGSYITDPKTVEGLTSCDAVVLVEKVYRSKMDAIYALKERAQTMDKPIVGMVLV